jgi:hypothetical protein
MTGHRHQWTGADFFLANGHPMMRQACACGTTREVRAFDVTWNPPISDGETEERLRTTVWGRAEPGS